MGEVTNRHFQIRIEQVHQLLFLKIQKNNIEVTEVLHLSK